MPLGASTTIRGVVRSGSIRVNRNPLRAALDNIRRMSWHDFFSSFSVQLPYQNMVSDMLEGFEGILEPSELDAVNYSRWEAPNEINYLDSLKNLNVRGGVYLGVATEPVNFSYICEVQPELAILVDINPAVARIHLPIKGALMELASSRVEFLSLVLGRSIEDRAIPELNTPADYVRFFSQIPASQVYREKIWQQISGRLAPEIRSEAHRIWLADFGIQPENSFSSSDVLMSKYIYWNMDVKDAVGQRTAWLASEQNYLYIRDMWQQGRIKGVTGDISGRILRNLGGLIREIGSEVSCFYISNVEDPIEINGRLSAFKRALGRLPWQYNGQIVRYDFGGQNQNAFNVRKVGLNNVNEIGFAGTSEAIYSQEFLYS